MNETEPSPPNLGLGEILQVLHRRWRNVVLVTVVVTAIVLVFTLLQSDKYKAKAVILVRTADSDTAMQADPAAQAPYYAARQQLNAAVALNSTAQREAVAKVFHGHADVQSVNAVALTDGSDAINLTATGSNANDTANLVNLYAQTYITNTQKSVDAVASSGEAAINQQLADLQTQQTKTQAPLTALQGEQAANPGDPRITEEIQTVTNQIAPQLSAIGGQIQALQTRLQNLKVSSSVSGAESAKLMTAATPPGSPASPNPLRNGVIGLVLGLGLGVAFALAKEFMPAIGGSSESKQERDGREPTSSRFKRRSASKGNSGAEAYGNGGAEAYGHRGAEAYGNNEAQSSAQERTHPYDGERGQTTSTVFDEHFASDDNYR